MDQLFNNYIYKFKQTNIENNSKILLFPNLKNNKIFNSKLINSIKLDLILKGLNKYNNNLILYLFSLTSNSNNSIISFNNYYTSKNTFSQSQLQVLPSFLQYNNLILLKKELNSFFNKKLNVNINIKQEKQENIKLKNNTKNKHSTYLELIKINNITNKNNNFNFASYINYTFNNNINYKMYTKMNDFLYYSFLSMNCLISKPNFELTNDKVIIYLFYYLFNFKTLNNNKILKYICDILSKFFKKPVELNLVRLYYPYNDSNILVNVLSSLINRIKLRIIMKNFFKKAIIKVPNKTNKILIRIPSFISGLKLKIGGRLMTHRIVPKKTVKIIRKGNLTKNNITFLDEARYTNKNKRGAFTLSISLKHYLLNNR